MWYGDTNILKINNNAIVTKHYYTTALLIYANVHIVISSASTYNCVNLENDLKYYRVRIIGVDKNRISKISKDKGKCIFISHYF